MSEQRAAPGLSFRDPAGSVFVQNGILKRRVNPRYEPHYRKLMESGLYRALVDRGLLIPHREPTGAELLLEPEQIAFISVPAEWCFSAFKDAALALLEIQVAAMDHGMTLKDAPAQNMQVTPAGARLIDTLSFEIRTSGAPWQPYRQFCEHFLAPLALAAYRDPRMGTLLQGFPHGVPLDLAMKLLPLRARLDPGIAMHLLMHARSMRTHGRRGTAAAAAVPLPDHAVRGLIDSLAAAVRRLHPKSPVSAWVEYTTQTSYSAAGAAAKMSCVRSWLDRERSRLVCDFGANNGAFSRAAADAGAFTIALDADPAVTDRLYRELRAEKDSRIVPLCVDLTRPAGGAGWRGAELRPLLDRARPDLALALALVHHLVIAQGIPLDQVAELFAELSPAAIVEFVPPDDPQAARLAAQRGGIVHPYDEELFRAAFERHFTCVERAALPESGRTLWFWKRQSN